MQDPDSQNQSYTSSNNTDSSNQLVWTNLITQTLNPEILRQLPFPNTLLHMVQSAKISLGVNLLCESGATPPIE